MERVSARGEAAITDNHPIYGTLPALMDHYVSCVTLHRRSAEAFHGLPRKSAAEEMPFRR